MILLMELLGQTLFAIKKLIKHESNKELTFRLSNSIATLQVSYDRLLELKRLNRL